MDGRGEWNFKSVAKQAHRLIVGLNRVRAAYGLDFEDILIFLAVAEINFSQGTLRAASAQSVAAFIQMPYETTRRRLLDLTEAKRLHRREHDGYIVADINLPKDLLAALLVEPEPGF